MTPVWSTAVCADSHGASTFEIGYKYWDVLPSSDQHGWSSSHLITTAKYCLTVKLLLYSPLQATLRYPGLDLQSTRQNAVLLYPCRSLPGCHRLPARGSSDLHTMLRTVSHLTRGTATPIWRTTRLTLLRKPRYGTAQCCATDVLGVADLNCADPPTVPTNASDFQAECSAMSVTCRPPPPAPTPLGASAAAAAAECGRAARGISV